MSDDQDRSSSLRQDVRCPQPWMTSWQQPHERPEPKPLTSAASELLAYKNVRTKKCLLWPSVAKF